MKRRQFLAKVGSTAALGSIAGCMEGEQSSIDTTGVTVPTPVQGNSEAPVTVAVFKDFACPHCRRYTLEVEPPLRRNYIAPGKIRYEFHDFPIPVSDWSYRIANLARAIQDKQGDDAFWQFETQVFQQSSDYSWDTVESLATKQAIARDQVRSVATAKQYRRVVEADRQNGHDRGVTGTPTVFVNNQIVKEWTYDNLAREINKALSVPHE